MKRRRGGPPHWHREHKRPSVCCSAVVFVRLRTARTELWRSSSAAVRGDASWAGPGPPPKTWAIAKGCGAGRLRRTRGHEGNPQHRALPSLATITSLSAKERLSGLTLLASNLSAWEGSAGKEAWLLPHPLGGRLRNTARRTVGVWSIFTERPVTVLPWPFH